MKELARFIIKNRVRIANKNTDYDEANSHQESSKTTGNFDRRIAPNEGAQGPSRAGSASDRGGFKSKGQSLSELPPAESAHSRYSMTEDAPSPAEREIAMMNPDDLDPTPKRERPSKKSKEQQENTVAPSRTVSNLSSTSNVQTKKTKFNDVSIIPDSWNVDAKIKPVVKREPEYRKRPGAKKIAAHKRRRNAMSLACSEEEEFILRTHANSKGMSFSEWARLVMFRAMGKKIPGRKEDDDY